VRAAAITTHAASHGAQRDRRSRTPHRRHGARGSAPPSVFTCRSDPPDSLPGRSIAREEECAAGAPYGDDDQGLCRLPPRPPAPDAYSRRRGYWFIQASPQQEDAGSRHVGSPNRWERSTHESHPCGESPASGLPYQEYARRRAGSSKRTAVGSKCAGL